MSISSIGSVGAAATPPAPVAKGPAKTAAAPPVATAAKVDADGDHDGSVGTKVNVKA